MGTFSSSPPPLSGYSMIFPSDPPVDEGYATMRSTCLSNDLDISYDTGERNGLEMMAEKPKQLMESIKGLRHLGIEAIDLPLPKICVVGDQSTGKSSLIEGISEIRVPRSADTCTRCPLEINLTESVNRQEAWNCNIFLTRKYRYDTKSKKEGASRSKPLGPWHEENQPQDVHFASLSSKEEVGSALKWAQVATLNPGNSPDKYKPGFNAMTQRTIQVPFSPNVVRLDISGPGLPNLSFYDLPGVINQDEEGYVVDLVKNLVKEYIHADNCIILHTLTMNYDAANSSAAAIINSMKADARTVGVLTKPDCVDKTQSLRQWKEILEGSRFRRALGYYVVKNNVDSEVDHATAREEEIKFFATTEPFSTEMKGFSERFGTMKLQAALSKMLIYQIKNSLPNIKEKIEEKALVCQEKLSRLPKPVEGNVSLEIHNKILSFKHDLKNEIDGGSIESSFFTSWHETAKNFRNQLVNSKPLLSMPSPNFVPSSESQSDSREPCTPGRRTVELIAVSDDDDNGIPTPSRAPKRAQQAGTKRTIPARDNSAQKRARVGSRIDDIPLHRENSVESGRVAGKPASPDARNVSERNKRFLLEDIRTMINSVNTGLPGSRDPKVTEKMHKESINHWPELVGELFQDTRLRCENLIKTCASSSFSVWEQTRIYEVVNQIVAKFLDRAFSEQMASVQSLLKMEMTKVMTFSPEEKDSHERDTLKALLEHSKESRCRNELAEMIQGGANVKQDQVKQLRQKIEAEPEPYHLEIQEMATVRSYYYCASKRFADYVGLSICTQLFAQCRDDLPKAIIKGLGLNRDDANEHCKRLLAFDASIEDERVRLLNEQKQLMKAQAWLSDLTKESQLQGYVS